MYLYYSNCNSNGTKHIANVFKQLSQFLQTTSLEDLMCLCFIQFTRVRFYTATGRYLFAKSSVPPVGRPLNTTAFKLINSHKD
jgi:hypothetical protein